MRTGAAFEFLGSMSGNFGDAEQYIGDTLSQLFDASLGILDAVGSVVSLWEMKKRTRLMEKVYSSRVFVEHIEKSQKSTDKEIAYVEKSERDSINIRISIKRSEAEELIAVAKNELKAQRERYRKEVEVQIGEIENRTERASNDAEEKRELRYLFMDAILISQTTIEELRENETRNHLIIAELEENIRKTTTLLRKSFNDVI